VLVTGAAGFIGSNLVDALLQRGDQVIGLDNFDPYYDPRRKRHNLAAALADPRFELIEADILDEHRLRSVMKSRKPEGVVHLAAQVGNRRSLEAATGERYDRVNAGGTATLLAACDAAPPRAFVFISTANVYDSAAPAPFREGSTPDRPRTPYSKSKKEAETMVLEAAARIGLQATVLRLFTTYGPRQRPDMVHSRFASSLLRDQPLPLIGSGSDLRDYIHVADACAAITACLGTSPAGEIINIGSGRATTLDQLVAHLARITGRKPLLQRRAAAANDTSRLLADIGKAERLLGWKPGIDLEAGLGSFVSWFLSAKNQFDKEGD